ncbi:retention module-containing protein, partial [Pseudomonas sp. ANT_H4]|uniref:retention module-containing protein n=3 Tax=unclassified Pseudomonas TaxID=196821 RepID=UPI0011F3A85B
MSSVVAIVKSIVGQVFVISPEGVRRVLVEGDRLFVGDQIDTGLSGAVSLELADGRTLDLGRDTQWSADAPDSSTDLAEATAQAAPSVAELQQAIAAGADPTTELEATAAGTTAAGTGAAGGGHSFVVLDATAGRVDPTIGFPTAGLAVTTAPLTERLAAQPTTNADQAGPAAPVPSTLTLGATPTITEAGGVLTYTATVTQAPTSDLSITLSNGSVITIPAGQLTGTVNVPMAPNDSPYIDPSQISVTVTGTTGGTNLDLTINPAPAVTQITDTIDTTTVTLTAGESVTEGGQITYTATLTNPAQTPVTVTLSNGSVITIEAGKSTGTVVVDTPANDVYNNGSTVSTTITGTTGGNFESLVPNTAPAETKIVDSLDNTGLKLSAEGSIVEGGKITYTATLTNPADTAVTVTLNSGAVITIEAGKTSGLVVVDTPVNDVYNNGSTVTDFIKSTTGGNFEQLTPNTAPVETKIVDSLDNTGLKLSAEGSIVEGGKITYTATLTNPADTAVTVTLNSGAVITIEAGKTSGFVVVDTPVNDVYNNGSTVTDFIKSTTGGNFEQLTPNTAPVETKIVDSLDNTGLTLSAEGSIVEGGKITYTATLTNPADTAVTVTLNSGAVITIEAGKTSGFVVVDTPVNDVYNNGSTVTDFIKSTTGGNFEQLTPNTAPVETKIVDSLDTTTIKLTASGEVSEGGQVTYTATLSHAAGSNMTVTLSNGAVIEIVKGNLSGETKFNAPTDDVFKDESTVSATIKPDGIVGGSFEKLEIVGGAADTLVKDTIDEVTVSLHATPSINEGGEITYTASLLGKDGKPVLNLGSDLVVKLANGETITIANNASSGTATITVPADVYVNPAISNTITQVVSGGEKYEKLTVSDKPAGTTVIDTETPSTIKLTASGEVSEGGQVTYTATLSHAAGSNMTVTLSNGAVIEIVKGNLSGETKFDAPTDDVFKDESTVSATIKPDGITGGSFEKLQIVGGAADTLVKDTIDEV